MMNRTVGGKRHMVDLELSLAPLDQPQSGNITASSAVEVCLDIDEEHIKASGYSKEELVNAINSGVETACVQGILWYSRQQSVSLDYNIYSRSIIGIPHPEC